MSVETRMIKKGLKSKKRDGFSNIKHVFKLFPLELEFLQASGRINFLSLPPGQFIERYCKGFYESF